MNNVESKAAELNYDMEVVKKELKRVASIKCRLKKQQGKKTYAEELSKALSEEELLKQVREYITGPKKTVTNFTQSDVDELSYEDTLKAIKSIQSKKSMTKWLTSVEGDNDEFRKACSIEEMLSAHRDRLAPTDTGSVRKSTIAELLSRADALSKEELVDALQSLM